MDLNKYRDKRWFKEIFSLAAKCADAEMRGNQADVKMFQRLIEDLTAKVLIQSDVSSSQEIFDVKTFLMEEARKAILPSGSSLH